MRVACVGSLNVDLALRLPHLPSDDETLPATLLGEFRGGKGANQATAAARLGASVALVGCVGRDSRGEELLAGLAGDGVDVTGVSRVEGVATGLALPLVTDGGEVAILIVPGANGSMGAELVERSAEVVAAADVVLLQGELPAAASARAAQIARRAGVAVVLNTAPADPAVLAAVAPLASVVIANAQEAALLGELPPNVQLVVTRGAAGAVVGDVVVASFPSEVVDPTGAGDAFCGAFAVALAGGADVVEAARTGCAAGALAVRVAGAIPSMPTRAAVDALLGGDSLS